MKKIFLKIFLMGILAGFCSAQQSNWLSTLFVNPTPSPYLSDWQNNPTLGRFTLTYTGSTPVSFTFTVRITSPQYGELATARSTQIDWPAGPNTQIYSPYDVINWESTGGVAGLQFNNAMKERIVRSGRFPEGDYTLEILVKEIPGGTLLNSASANFSIIYPDPPQLILPQNQDLVQSPLPIFQWTLVNTPPSMPVTYKIKIVERLTGQTPSQALAANPVHHLDSVVGIGMYNYTPTYFPFVTGKEYVWQVSATDQDGNPITSNNGKSEIWTFSFGNALSAQIPDPDTVQIVQGVAYLINLKTINHTPYQEGLKTGIIYNGSPKLILIINGEEKAFNVTVTNLLVWYEFLPPKLFLYTIEGDIDFSINSKLTIGGGCFFRISNFSWSTISGASLGGSLILPGINTPIPLSGRLPINAAGISGVLNAERPVNNPLYTLGEGIARMLITQASIHFPEPEVRLGGIFQLFGVNSNCSVQDLKLSTAGVISGSVNCSFNTAVNLVPNSNRLQLNFNSISGQFSANINSRTFTFDFSANAGLDFRSTDTTSYGADLVTRLANSGFSLVSFTPRQGTLAPPPVDLGWVRLIMSNLNLTQLSYSGGSWDFAMGMNIQIVIPSLDNLTLPLLNGASLGTGGLTIPAINLSSLNLPQINFQSFLLQIAAVRMPSVTIPFFSGGAGATTGMNFSFDMRMRFGNLPGGSLGDQVFNITNASFNNGVFSASIQPVNFPDPGVTVMLSPEVPFHIKEISGSITADFRGQTPSFNPNIRIRGVMGLPPIFSCSSGGNSLNLMTASLTINGSGEISGRIENINPACSIELPPLTLTFSNIAIDFSRDATGQKIRFEGNVRGRLPNPAGGAVEGVGTIDYEVLANRLIALSVAINNPFSLNIPSSAPVFTFQIPRARINQESIIIDGRSYLALPGGTNIGCTFRAFNLRWRDFTIASGDVVFDNPFAFKVTLGEGGGLRFATVRANSSFNEQTGIMLNLPQSFSLGANGFRANGTSRVQMRFQGTSLDTLLSNFTNDFGIQLNPFQVNSGQIDFNLGNRRVAYINPSGFFPDMAYFASAVLPARIPLPVPNIAYIQIKQGDNFLINYESVQNGVRISTRPGQPVKLVMPVLRFNRPEDPSLDVTFDVIIDPQNYRFVSGSILVNIPATERVNWDWSSRGIPLTVERVLYGELNAGYGLQLTGKLKMFGNNFSEDVSFSIYSNGRLTGEVDFNLSETINLVPNSDKLTLNLTRVAGTFDIQLNPLNPIFDLRLTGGIRLNLGGGRRYGANATFRVSRAGINVEDFVLTTRVNYRGLIFHG